MESEGSWMWEQTNRIIILGLNKDVYGENAQSLLNTFYTSVLPSHQLLDCDELNIISGYVGPKPIENLQNLPIRSRVIYGMYACDGICKSLHEALVHDDESLSKVEIFYSTIPVHAKCYLWKKSGRIVSALVGSANFSTNGLTTPFKEVLADATFDTFSPLENYLAQIMSNAISCHDGVVKNNAKKPSDNSGSEVIFDPEVCSMPLYVIKNGKKVIEASSGINWGMAKKNGSHVTINDAYIAIGAELTEHYPQMFPQKTTTPTKTESLVANDTDKMILSILFGMMVLLWLAFSKVPDLL